jgi:hypothetical protein
MIHPIRFLIVEETHEKYKRRRNSCLEIKHKILNQQNNECDYCILVIPSAIKVINVCNVL